MRILIVGANGFIGSRVVARLIEDGHVIVAAVRDPSRFERRFPGTTAIHCDLNEDVEPAVWVPRLRGVEAVVNCAGALQSGRRQNLEAIHHRAPVALFEACVRARVRRVVHVSAISADPAAGTEYARTKVAAEAHLRRTPLRWTILRPSLVYAEGSYGGTSLMRGLAALPFVIPLPGSGNQPFRPIHVEDLARTIAICLDDDRCDGMTLEPVGPQRLSLVEILLKWRSWLGLEPALPMTVPMAVVHAAARIGDLFGAGPLRSTAVRQLIHGNAGDSSQFDSAIGFEPRSMDVALARAPASTQDLWHARLYFAKPLLRVALAFFWIGSGIATALANPASLGDVVALETKAMSAAIWVGAVVDIGLGGWLLGARRAAPVCLAMLGVSLFYLIVLSLAAPALWLDPFGSLAKIPVIMTATLILLAIDAER